MPPAYTREQVQACLEAYCAANGNKAKAALAMGIPITTFKGRFDACKRYGLEVPRYENMVNQFPPVEEKRQVDELKEQVAALKATNKHLIESAYDVERMKAWIRDVCGHTLKPHKWQITKPRPGSMGTPVLVVSDWHWGETVQAAQVGGVNAYNRDIAAARMQRMFSTAVELWMSYFKTPTYDRFILPIIGDMLSGTIHEELSETNWDSILPLTWDLSEHLIAGIDLLLKHFPSVDIPSVVGNHGRLQRKPRYKNRQVDNYEWNLLHILAAHYRNNERVRFDIADSTQLPFSVYNTQFVASHGDEYHGGGGISGSWSPIIRGDAKQRKQAMAIAKPYQYRIIGHWHFRETIQNVRKNGSGKGWDEYAMINGYDFQIAQQDMFLVHPDMGITFEAPVYLETPGTTFNLRNDAPQENK